VYGKGKSREEIEKKEGPLKNLKLWTLSQRLIEERLIPEALKEIETYARTIDEAEKKGDIEIYRGARGAVVAANAEGLRRTNERVIAALFRLAIIELGQFRDFDKTAKKGRQPIRNFFRHRGQASFDTILAVGGVVSFLPPEFQMPFLGVTHLASEIFHGYMRRLERKEKPSAVYMYIDYLKALERIAERSSREVAKVMHEILDQNVWTLKSSNYFNQNAVKALCGDVLSAGRLLPATAGTGPR